MGGETSCATLNQSFRLQIDSANGEFDKVNTSELNVNVRMALLDSFSGCWLANTDARDPLVVPEDIEDITRTWNTGKFATNHFGIISRKLSANARKLRKSWECRSNDVPLYGLLSGFWRSRYSPFPFGFQASSESRSTYTFPSNSIDLRFPSATCQ